MSTVAKIIAAVAFAFFLMAIGSHVATMQSSRDHQRLTTDVATLAEGNATLRDQNAKLKRHITGLHTDARVIERHARDQLGLIRHDEILILLNQPEPPRRQAVSATPQAVAH